MQSRPARIQLCSTPLTPADLCTALRALGPPPHISAALPLRWESPSPSTKAKLSLPARRSHRFCCRWGKDAFLVLFNFSCSEPEPMGAHPHLVALTSPLFQARTDPSEGASQHRCCLLMPQYSLRYLGLLRHCSSSAVLAVGYA